MAGLLGCGRFVARADVMHDFLEQLLGTTLSEGVIQAGSAIDTSGETPRTNG